MVWIRANFAQKISFSVEHFSITFMLWKNNISSKKHPLYSPERFYIQEKKYLRFVHINSILSKLALNHLSIHHIDKNVMGSVKIWIFLCGPHQSLRTSKLWVQIWTLSFWKVTLILSLGGCKKNWFVCWDIQSSTAQTYQKWQKWHKGAVAKKVENS